MWMTSASAQRAAGSFFQGTRANIPVFSGGGGIDTFNVEDPAAIKAVDSKVYDALADKLESPLDQARPHQAILDPTGDFLVFPDLGADLLRVLKVDKATLKHTEAVCVCPSGLFLSNYDILTMRIGELRVCAWHRP
jgi:hypothetical protein